jgi:phosphate:Na+ symporter
MLTLAELLAGLGLLFVGLRLVGLHLQQATGRGLRRILQAATRSPALGMLSGAAAGVATQSSNAITLIAGNLVRGGTLTVRDAIPVVGGANVGTAALVFLAAIDFHLAVLYIVALVGLAYQLKLDAHPRRRDWAGVALGLALLFLGLDFIKAAPGHLPPGQLTALIGGGLSPALAFVAGVGMATLTQSASTATILAVAAVQSRVVGLDDGVWLVLGANVGSGVAVMLAGSGLTGSGRQLCLVQVLVKLAGSGLVAGAWLIAQAASPVSPAAWALEIAGGRLSPTLSILFLVLQLSGALLVTVLRSPVERWVRALSPPSTEERASRPRFIYDRAVEDPPNALLLAQRECERLIGLLPGLLPDLDQPDEDRQARVKQTTGHAAIAVETEAFMVELIDRHLHRKDLDTALQVQATLALLRSLQQALTDFAAVVDSFSPPPPLVFRLSESLRTLSLLLADASLPHADAEDARTLIELTSDRGELLNRIRQDLAASREQGEHIRRLLLAASLFERSVWLLGRLAAALLARPAQ